MIDEPDPVAVATTLRHVYGDRATAEALRRSVVAKRKGQRDRAEYLYQVSEVLRHTYGR